MSDDVDDADQLGWTTAAFDELRSNLEYARQLIRGGRYLERLKVGAFDVTDLYRAAWVQAVSALDHWVHRELYDRALGFALNASVPRPAKFLRLQVPMSLFEDVHHHAKTIREAFQSYLKAQFGYQSFQAPEKIKQALSHISDASLWPDVAKQLGSNDEGPTVSADQVQARLRQIVHRRNRIAHEADRSPEHRGARQPVTDHDATETIDWVEQIADAILRVIGPPPISNIDAIGDPGKPQRARWTRQDVDAAVGRLDTPGATAALRRLLGHADTHKALLKGGVSPEPSAGLYYWLHGKRRSLWSLYTTADRPSITLNFGSISPSDDQLALQMIAEIRRHPSLDAALLHDDEILAGKYPAIDLAILAESPDAVDTLIRALDLAIRPRPKIET